MGSNSAFKGLKAYFVSCNKRKVNLKAILKTKINCLLEEAGDGGSTVVKVLRYKSEGRWFDPSW